MNAPGLSNTRRLTLALFCLAFTVSGLRAQPAAQPRKVASVEGISEYDFQNGLRLLLFPDDSQSRVTVNLTVLVGSRRH